MKAQIISGKFGEIVARQKNDEKIELGELLIAEQEVDGSQKKVLLQVTDIEYGAQISQQNLELVSGMFLEEDQEITLYEKHLRTYRVAKVKGILEISGKTARSTKDLPPLFAELRDVQSSDFSFFSKSGFSVGNMRSGSRELTDLQVYLDEADVLSHHVLIPATTGKGKSNLMRVMLWNLLESQKCAMLVLDPHDEYFGRTTLGLSSHPTWSNYGSYYTPNNPPAGANSLVLSIQQLKPKHFSGVTGFSTAQQDLLFAYYSTFGKEWIIEVMKESSIDYDFHEATLGVVKRRLAQILGISYSNKTLHCSTVFSDTQGKSTLRDIAEKIANAKTVIVDTSSLSGQRELLVSSLLTEFVYAKYKKFKSAGEKKPVACVVLEEAPRVIGKEVLEKGQNVFGTIAREGRKFNVGLCAITQLPSMIPKDILANMNTKIVLGLELAQERQAIIDSAAQDLSSDSRTIASLDKGEAIITSNFARFATPIKIPLFDTLVKSTPKPEKKLIGI